MIPLDSEQYRSCPCPSCNPELNHAISDALINQKKSFRWRDQLYRVLPDDTYERIIARWCRRNPPEDQ